jgi:flavin-binding protein dodecin
MRYSLPLISALILLVAACASPTPYKPATKAGGAGYSDTRIETDRYRVSFSTSAGGAQAAQDMALRRAADLTLQQGYDWFEVTQRDTDVNRNSGSSFSLGVGGASFGRSSATGVGASVGIPVGAGPAATASLEIRMGKGAKPTSSNAYDARGVQASFAGRN